ncbi:MAG: hypothetical protein ACLGI3_20505 [Actinomycetes bacterium]
MGTPQSAPTDRPDDPATRALEDLVVELDACIAELEHARTRSAHLLEKREAGRPWLEIVTGEARPLVVESISTVLGSLATAGHAWRREQASALQRENVSINRIAALFGVTRQRISALLRERDVDARPADSRAASSQPADRRPADPAAPPA